MTFTIPPATKTIGDSGLTDDLNSAYAALAAIAGRNVLDSQWAGGADPTGVSDSSPAVQAAVDDAISAGSGLVYMPTGTYRFDTEVTGTMPSSGIYSVLIVGDGQQATIIDSHITGDVFRFTSSSANMWGQGTGWKRLTIDGTNAGSNSCGIHVGDITGLQISEVEIVNFNQSGSVPVWFENTTYWTEECDVRMDIRYCTSGPKFSSSGTGTNSFGYSNLDFKLFQAGGNFDGIVLDGSGNGCYLYHSTLRLRGNFSGSGSALSNAVIRMTAAQIRGVRLDVQVETTSGTYTPTTLILDSSSSILGAYGILAFSAGGGSFTTASFNRGQIGFQGVISGDTGLHPSASYNNWVFASLGRPIQPSYTSGVTGGGFPTTLADMFDTTLSGNLTVKLTSSYYDGNATMGGPQRIVIRIKQASGGGYTVTWPSTGSPSTSSPTVKWPGGSAPTMSSGANAEDIYELLTFDGATWYGVAHQAMA